MALHTSHASVFSLAILGAVQPVLTEVCTNYDPTNPTTIATSLFLGVLALVDWYKRNTKKTS